MLELRMTIEIDFAVDPDRLVLGFNAVEFDASISRDRGDACKPAKKIEMPPGTTKFTVGGKL